MRKCPWPGKPPDAVTVAGPEYVKMVGDPAEEPVVGKVSRPTMTVYPPQGKNTGAAVVVFPGGGYWVLYMALEGTDVCDWLTSKGITCVLLKYRVPGENRFPRSGAYPKSPAALEDAQRTVGLVRLHAAKWGIDPHKIGVLGFSAGGHLVAAVSTHFKRRLYRPVDAADKESCRPDFGVALYPGHMLENTSQRNYWKEFDLNPYVPVTPETPPMFLLQAEDDPIDTVKNSLVYYAALRSPCSRRDAPVRTRRSWLRPAPHEISDYRMASASGNMARDNRDNRQGSCSVTCRKSRPTPLHARRSAMEELFRLAKNRLSDNVGGVKQFSSTLQHALGEERQFRSR
ncbi:MAG: alpha/beta hydrolase [Candidatus Sulfotelmatobacter sp.]